MKTPSLQTPLAIFAVQVPSGAQGGGAEHAGHLGLDPPLLRLSLWTQGLGPVPSQQVPRMESDQVVAAEKYRESNTKQNV